MTVVYPVLDVIVVDINVLGALVVTREASAAATLERAVSVECREQVTWQSEDLLVRRPESQSVGEASEQRRKQRPLQPQAPSWPARD